jgi:cell division protein FtsQ
MSKNGWSGWLTAITFLGVVVLLLRAMDQSDEKIIRGIGVEITPLADGHSLMVKEDVGGILNKLYGNSLIGTPVAQIDVKVLEEALRKEPIISVAEVYIDAKQMLNVAIEQRKPLLRVMDQKGGNYYLDKEGRALPLSSHFTARVPIVTGEIEVYDDNFLYLKNFNLKHVFLLAKRMLEDEFYEALTEQFVVYPGGEIEIIPKIGRTRILFGEYSDVDEKLENLMIFLTEIQSRQGWKDYESIDISFKGQVVCKRA